MSKINDLIKELCPDGVEYKKVWEVTTWDKKYNSVDKIMQPDIKKYNYLLANQLNEIVDPDGDVLILETGINGEKKYTNIDLAGDNLCNAEIIAIPWGGTPNVKYYKGKFVTGDNRIAISNDTKLLDTKFLYYIFENRMNEIADFYRGSGIKHPEMKKILLMNIPIPPLEVQEEIVRILDKFGELEAELEAELEVRKSQYEFWRGKLLNNRKYSVVSLGDYATFSQGIQVDPKDQKDYCDDGMVPFLRIVDFVKDDEPPRYIIKPDNKYIKKENEEMVMIRYGASAAGKVFINKYGAIANNMFKINLTTNEIEIKYLWHYLSQDKIYKSLNNTGGGSTMPAINFKMASSIQVVLPPKEEQNTIVKILDKFDALVNDITVGLPAEIELRRQQYEYYRNKLLSFEELSVSE